MNLSNMKSWSINTLNSHYWSTLLVLVFCVELDLLSQYWLITNVLVVKYLFNDHTFKIISTLFIKQTLWFTHDHNPIYQMVTLVLFRIMSSLFNCKITSLQHMTFKLFTTFEGSLPSPMFFTFLLLRTIVNSHCQTGFTLCHSLSY